MSFPDTAALRELYSAGADQAKLVRALHEQAGSDDKLAVALSKHGSKAKRQQIMKWRRGGGIDLQNAKALAALSRLPLDAFPRRRRQSAAQALLELEDVRVQTQALVERGELLARRLEALLDAAEGRLGEG